MIAHQAAGDRAAVHELGDLVELDYHPSAKLAHQVAGERAAELAHQVAGERDGQRAIGEIAIATAAIVAQVITAIAATSPQVASATGLSVILRAVAGRSLPPRPRR